MSCHRAAFLHLQWEPGPRLCFRLAEVQVQNICVTKRLCVCSLHAPMCSSIIFWLSDFLYLPATGFSPPSIYPKQVVWYIYRIVQPKHLCGGGCLEAAHTRALTWEQPRMAACF